MATTVYEREIGFAVNEITLRVNFLPSHYVRFLNYAVYEITQTVRFLLYHHISFQEFAVKEIKDLNKKRFV